MIRICCDKCGSLLREVDIDKNDIKIYNRVFMIEIREAIYGTSVSPSIFIDSLRICENCVNKLRLRKLPEGTL